MVAETKDRNMEGPSSSGIATSSLMFPAAALAAGSALGLSLASNALGIWLGALSVAAGASRRERVSSPLPAEIIKHGLIKAPDAAQTEQAEVYAGINTGSFEPENALLEGSDLPGAEASGEREIEPAQVESDLGFVAPQPDVALPEPVFPMAELAAVDDLMASASVLQLSASASDLAVSRAIDTAIAAETLAPPVVWTQPNAVERPEAPDDLRLLSGIGPKVQKRLHELGIWTFAQVADWDESEIGWVDKKVSLKGRAVRDDWVGQARRMVRSGGTS